MSRVNVPVNLITRTGIQNDTVTPVTGDSTNNHQLANNGKCWIEAKNTNGSATSHTVTAKFAETVDGQAITSRAYPIPAGKTQRIGPWPTKEYGTTMLIDVNSNEFELTAWQLG
jgi:hypothetical protein